ncbi:UNVERIFIED_CONTAM: hypothetical protein Slati_2746100, partial [Sesamum latifolium]
TQTQPLQNVLLEYEEVIFLIHGQRGIEANPLKIKVILDMKAPTNVNEVQQLTGRIDALSHFISKAAEKSLPFFKMLRKAKTFEWDAPCQQTFEEHKSYLVRLLLLVKPSPGDTLYLYLSTTPQAISSILIREEEGKQMPIYYVSKVLRRCRRTIHPHREDGPTTGSQCQKISPYLLSYSIEVKTNLPLKQTLGKPDTSRRLVNSVVELSEYDISYLPRTTIKAQALADFVSEMA